MVKTTREINAQKIALERKKRIQKQRRKKLIIPCVCVCVLAPLVWFFGSGTASLVLHKTKVSFIQKASQHGFALKQLHITGVSNLSEAHVSEAAGLYVGQPMFAISVGFIKNQLEHVGWIKHAKVYKEMPETLHIAIVEREPTAIWQHQGEVHLISNDGVIIQSNEVGPYSHLPIVIGENAHLYLPHLLELLAKMPGLVEQFDSASWVSGRRWNVTLKNRITLKLPENNTPKAIETLEALTEEKKLFERAIKTIDLRLDDRVFIGTDEE